jgi:hypothetical protein
MKLIISIFILLFMSVNVYAGSNFTELSKSTEIVDWDKWVKAKLEAEEYAKRVGATVVTSSMTSEIWHP